MACVMLRVWGSREYRLCSLITELRQLSRARATGEREMQSRVGSFPFARWSVRLIRIHRIKRTGREDREKWRGPRVRGSLALYLAGWRLAGAHCKRKTLDYLCLCCKRCSQRLRYPTFSRAHIAVHTKFAYSLLSLSYLHFCHTRAAQTHEIPVPTPSFPLREMNTRIKSRSTCRCCRRLAGRATPWPARRTSSRSRPFA